MGPAVVPPLMGVIPLMGSSVVGWGKEVGISRRARGEAERGCCCWAGKSRASNLGELVGEA